MFKIIINNWVLFFLSKNCHSKVLSDVFSAQFSRQMRMLLVSYTNRLCMFEIF